MKKVTAVESLKTFAASTPSAITDMQGTLRRFIADKSYPLSIVIKMAKENIFGQAFRQLVLREEGATDGTLFNYMATILPGAKPALMAEYTGQESQNMAIDRAIANSGHRNTPFHIHGEGATSYFTPTNLSGLTTTGSTRIRDTRIAIIGYGAAGIIAHRALASMGFSNVAVFEKSRNGLGIWSQKNVYDGTKNNPRILSMLDQSLPAGPGPGIDVKNFLENLQPSTYGVHRNSAVKSIVPRSFDHAVHSEEYGTNTFPIVINTMGMGKPRPLSDPKRMTTSATSTIAGPRWQQTLTENDVRNKKFVFIGLGNSTAEMLRQIHKYADEGVEVDYRIITHYPEDAVWNPRSYVEHDGRLFRVFRDLSKLNLVDFQGDLPDSLRDYQRALHAKKILYGVKRWEIKGDKVGVFNAKGNTIAEVGYDKIFSLTGYQHSEASFTPFGCTYNPEGNCARYDYDGEFIADPAASGEDRLYKGYFGFGSILESAHNQNAIVIPGMLHRLGDLLFGVLMRATENQHRR